MNTSLKWIAAFAVGTALALPTVASGAAAAPVDGPSKRVRVSDLDLAKDSDVQTLYERLQQAANEVCRDEEHRYYDSTRRFAPRGWRQRCVSDAIDRAVDDVGNPRLAALHAGAETVA